jgi:hypothetical protein
VSINRYATAAAMVLLVAGAASAQGARPTAAPAGKAAKTPATPEPAPPPAPSRMEQAKEKGEEIVTQPARDVGVSKVEIPPVLLKASEAPYGLKDVRTCKQLSTAMTQLSAVLGPDLAGGEAKPENRAGKLAEAGGKTVINAILPFRSLVREVSGAAPAERRLAAAVNAGFARRGFLRGVYTSRNCKPRL